MTDLIRERMKEIFVKNIKNLFLKVIDGWSKNEGNMC